MLDARRLSPNWRLHATIAALTLAPLVHVVSLDRLTRWIGRAPPPPQPDADVDDPSLAEWVDRVLTRLPGPWKSTCLKRALVLQYLTRRTGRPADLRIGVRRNSGHALAAHAWLTRDDRLYLEPGRASVESYQLLATFPARIEPDAWPGPSSKS